ncbi:hypothetical protein AB3S75_000160 [Citrus x aurantiifolia]
MLNPIPESVKKIWDDWNIRGVILFSLSLQAVLVLFAPLRKATGNKLIISVIWSAYLLADWAANFGVGLITERARDTPTAEYSSNHRPAENNELLAFWATFFMLHLGGPDTITAFALEDNELWLRHLFGFIFQAVAAVYIFLTSLPGNKLFFPTVLVFIAGMIKYFERIRALYLASMEKFRDSALRGEVEHLQRFHSLQQNGNVVRKTQGDYLEVGCRYFKLFKLILVDLISSFESLNYEEPLFDDFSPEKALGIIEVELNLVYEVLHTKIQVTHSVLGIILRFVCFCSVVAALSVFHFQVEKHGFNQFDVCVTYTLFLGAIALDIIAFFMLVFSNWTFVALRNDDDKSRLGLFKNRIAAILSWFIILNRPRWHSQSGGKYEVLATPFLFRKWSGSVSGSSWMRYWLKGSPSRVPKVKSGLHLACRKVIHYLGIDRLIPCMAIATNKVIQFLHIYKIIALFDRSDIVYEIRIETSLNKVYT